MKDIKVAREGAILGLLAKRDGRRRDFSFASLPNI